MSFYKWLASVGIGSVKVDTQIKQAKFRPGDLVDGEMVIRGGESQQQIDDIYLYLVTSYRKEDKMKKYVFYKYQLTEKMMIEPGQERRVPFQVKLPVDLPMSTGQFPIYLKTVLDIRFAMDPTDEDRIEVKPPEFIETILEEVANSGFVLYKVENLYNKKAVPHPFYQVFQFKPSMVRGLIDEFNMIFHYDEMKVAIDFEMVRAERVLHTQFTWSLADPVHTLCINDHPFEADPIEKIKELLRRQR
jgi:sporulation-control protein